MLDEHEEPIAYDLLRLGLRLRDLGTDRLSWGDLWTVVTQAPADSALYRAMNPGEADWTLSTLLLAEVVDSLRIATWQRGGGKKKDYPKPVPRPGITPDSTTYGKGAVSMDQIADWLGWTH